jgi:hypothetical protein
MKEAKLLSFISASAAATAEEERRYTEGYSQSVSRLKPWQKTSDQILGKEWSF